MKRNFTWHVTMARSQPALNGLYSGKAGGSRSRWGRGSAARALAAWRPRSRRSPGHCEQNPCDCLVVVVVMPAPNVALYVPSSLVPTKAFLSSGRMFSPRRSGDDGHVRANCHLQPMVSTRFLLSLNLRIF